HTESGFVAEYAASSAPPPPSVSSQIPCVGPQTSAPWMWCPMSTTYFPSGRADGLYLSPSAATAGATLASLAQVPFAFRLEHAVRWPYVTISQMFGSASAEAMIASALVCQSVYALGSGSGRLMKRTCPTSNQPQSLPRHALPVTPVAAHPGCEVCLAPSF